MANQGNPMGGTPQQPRMARPMMSNNPGLRHLLQQQPQYRQMMGMQGMGGNPQRPQMGQQMQNSANNPQNTFDDVNNFEFM